MKVFLITGKAGSGKNELANILKDKLGNAVVTSLSKYIKVFALELTNWNGDDAIKPREFLQQTGDQLRAIDKNFLTKRLLEDIEFYDRSGIKNVIVSDVRLLNEIDYFKSISNLEIYTIRVNCASSIRSLTDGEKNHITEIELDNYENFDFVIDNKFDASLVNEVEKILEGLK